MNISEALINFEKSKIDIYAYTGTIERSGYERICDVIEAKAENRREHAILFLCTGGGNPNAGYRIARAFIHHYGSDKFSVAVPAECKSAGTLVCIGAQNIIMFDKGELGPLDVQFQKKDELFQQSSGLDILRGMTYLKNDALATFNSYLVDINASSGLSTKVASEIVVNLVRGIYEPMYAQIDPVRLGEMNAALQIAHEYGTRLHEKSKSLKTGALSKLINNYPTHGFVIDRAEARTLFERVVSPEPEVKALYSFVTNVLWRGGQQREPYVLDLTSTLESYFSKEIADAKHTAGAAAAGEAGSVPAGTSGQSTQGDGTEQLPSSSGQGDEPATA